ncbi:MAG: HNH endonuclease [Candidatus Brocadia sp.]
MKSILSNQLPGGCTDNLKNLQTLCWSCNQCKTDAVN